MNIPLNSSEEELVSALRRENCCLMTDEEGVELYDGQGNLLICKAESGECLAVPNIEALRKLYDLPIDGEEASDYLNHENKTITKKGELLNLRVDSLNDQTETFILHEEEKCPVVWLGQRTTKCQEAAKALIKLFDSPKYRRLMNDKTTIKLKVWERLACELQEQNGGIKIADTPRDAGLRTFQKWRNMERTYWKYLRNPDECGDDKRRKKPWFFDDMHAVLSKRKRNSRYTLNGQESELDEHFTDEEMMDGIFATDEIPQELRQKQGVNASLTPDGVENLLKLIDKYRDLFREGGKKKMKVWEKVHQELVDMGFEVPGESKRMQIERLFQKWRNLKKGFIKYHIDQEGLYGKNRKKPKLLHYDLLFKMCSKDIFEAEQLRKESNGDLEDCQQTSCQVFANLDHDYGATAIPDILEDTISPMAMETSPTAPEVSAADTGPANSHMPLNPPITSSTLSIPTVTDTSKHMSTSFSTKLPLCPTQPTTSVKSAEILLQIKLGLETALAAQQQNLSRITSLLEEQVKEQKTLNLLFTQYVTTVSKKHKSSKNSLRNNETNSESKECKRNTSEGNNHTMDSFEYVNVGNDYSNLS